jgi:hypothetical protein
MKERTVTTAMHVLLTLAVQETVFTLLWFVLISIHAQKNPAILLKDAFTLLNMTAKLSDNKINVTPTLVMF